MRKRHCLMVRPRRCIWGGDRETGIEGSQGKRMEKALLDGHKDQKQLLPVVGLQCGTIMVARIRRSNFCQLGCFGKDWNRRESEGKALLGKVAEGCG